MNNIILNRIDEIKKGEVPEGYEKTSFGIFPATWEKSKKLKELGVFGKGKGIPGNEMTDKGLPCVGYGDLYMKYNVYFDKAQCFVDQKTAKNSKPITKGTLLFTGTGETALEIGKCVCYYGDETIYAGGDILLFNSSKVNPLFLAHQQNIDFAIRQKARYGQGHSVVHIQRNNLEKLHVAYPKSPVEQQQIANVLMVWDKAIEAQNQYKTALEKKKKALMQKLLQPKAHWRPNKLSKILIEECCYVGDSIVEPMCVGVYGMRKRSEVYSKELSTNYSKNKVVKPLQLCFGIGSDSIVYDVLFEENEYCVSPAYKVCSFQNADPYFIKALLDTNKGRLSKKFLIISARQGKSVDFAGLFNEKMLMPEIQEQKEIASILAMADAEISMEKAKLELYKLQKKSLMQLLLTGIVRTIDNG